MKKFKFIRNILVVLILIVAIVYVCWIRTSKITTSKAYKIFSNMDENHNLNKNRQITMHITCDNEKIKDFRFIQATDEENGQEISYISHSTYNMYPEENAGGIVTVTTNSNTKIYNIFPLMNKYRIIYNSEEGGNIDSWITTYIHRLEKCKYYTKGYEFIDGNLFYYEKFKDTNLKFYFSNDELVYIKDSNIDDGFSNVIDNLYNVKITYDNSYKEFTEIPADYTEYKVNESEVTEDTEKINHI